MVEFLGLDAHSVRWSQKVTANECEFIVFPSLFSTSEDLCL